MSASFTKYCLDDIEKHEMYAVSHGLMDPDGTIRIGVFQDNFREIEPLWAPGVSAVVQAGSHFAAIHEFLRDERRARHYFWLGSHEWNYDGMDYPNMAGNEHVLRIKPIADRIIRADDLVLMQLPAAVCCDRVGEYRRAEQLFGWVVRLREATDGDYMEFMTSFGEREGWHEVWGRKSERAYALSCLGRWGEAKAEASGAMDWLARDPSPRTSHEWRSHYWLLCSLCPLIEYKLNPGRGSRAAALGALRPSILRSEDHRRTLFLLFYLNNLRRKV